MKTPIQRRFAVCAALSIVLALLVSQAACAGPTPSPISGHPRVRIEMADGHSMVIELYPEYAPETVANFLSLVDEGFYDGLTFHRIASKSIVQGGDPKGDGTGGSSKTIKGEFTANGFKKNTLSHTFGTISMARSEKFDSASSQFFLIASSSGHTSLDGDYAAFGRLVDGSSLLIAIAAKPVERNETTGEISWPVDPVVIARIVRVEDDATPTQGA